MASINGRHSQSVQVLLADDDVPRQQFVLRHAGLVIRVAVANRVQRLVRVVVGQAAFNSR